VKAEPVTVERALARAEPRPARVEHLYLHVPFCAHRCGYCDFVTARGDGDTMRRYVSALVAQLAALGPRTGARPRTVFVGGGTPSLLPERELARLLAALPPAHEVTVECNPETVTPALARLLRDGGVTRISLGVQTFRPSHLATLERLASPDAVRRAYAALRDAGHDDVNVDLLFGIPGQTPADLDADLADALALGPDHVSYYELEAKPGTRFTHRHGAALARQAEAMEDYYEAVVARLRDAGYRWYETANFCRPGHECRHNLGYWLGRDYLGLGVGAVSTVAGERRRYRPSVRRYVETVERGEEPDVDVERVTPDERGRERLMLGLRLDRPLAAGNGLAALVDWDAVARLRRAGLVGGAADTLILTERGRFLANDVLASILR
jgi:oxygen-independent coproporphyrinogen-3 oxidase